METTEVRFFGHRDIDWYPEREPRGPDNELRQQMASFLRDECVNGEDAGYRAFCTAFLAIILDPSSTVLGLNAPFLEQLAKNTPTTDPLAALCRLKHQELTTVTKAWQMDGKDGENQEEEEDVVTNPEPANKPPSTKGKGKAPGTQARYKKRGLPDVRAQRTVPQWYGARCILSGLDHPQGAHIVPVRAVKSANVHTVWKILRGFWDLPELDELSIEGREVTNILPLSPDAHMLWDRYAFALRPIEHPNDPEHRLYLQMVWLQDLDKEGGLASGSRDYNGRGGIADFRRGAVNGPYVAVIQHGDVYEIHTRDPVRRPLPSLRMLQIQYAVHKIMAGMRAAGALAAIFRGDPPGKPDWLGYRVIPVDRASLLEAAVEAGVLDREKAQEWEASFARQQAYDEGNYWDEEDDSLSGLDDASGDD